MAIDMKKLRAAAAEKAEAAKSEGGDFAPWLDLDEGDEFVGKITAIRNNTFDDSGKTHIFEASSIDDDDDVYSIRAHKALVSKIEGQSPEIGKIVYIRNLGKVKSTKSNFKYTDYEVGVFTQEEYDEMTGTTSSKKPAKASEKKPAKPGEDEEEKPAKKPAKAAPKEEELDEDDAKVKKAVERALEFNDNEIDIDELVRLCKAKSIKFKDLKEAKAKFMELGFSVSTDGLVSKSE